MINIHHAKRSRKQDHQPSAFKVGASVRLKNGPMAGEVGRVDRVNHGTFSINIRNIVRMNVTGVEIEAVKAG